MKTAEFANQPPVNPLVAQHPASQNARDVPVTPSALRVSSPRTSIAYSVFQTVAWVKATLRAVFSGGVRRARASEANTSVPPAQRSNESASRPASGRPSQTIKTPMLQMAIATNQRESLRP